jgi:hypothetical protein
LIQVCVYHYHLKQLDYFQSSFCTKFWSFLDRFGAHRLICSWLFVRDSCLSFSIREHKDFIVF